MILVYTPCKDEKEAEKIVEILLQETLVACANILPSKSMYFWQNKLCKETEAILLLKTTDKNATAVEKRIKELRSYELPCILKFSCGANKKFEQWVEQNTAKHF